MSISISKPDASTLDLHTEPSEILDSDLETVVGGIEADVAARGVKVGVRSTPDTPAETYTAENRRSAYEAFPDTRWFFQRWTNTGTDTNARTRADWLAQQNRAVLPSN